MVLVDGHFSDVVVNNPRRGMVAFAVKLGFSAAVLIAAVVMITSNDDSVSKTTSPQRFTAVTLAERGQVLPPAGASTAQLMKWSLKKIRARKYLDWQTCHDEDEDGILDECQVPNPPAICPKCPKSMTHVGDPYSGDTFVPDGEGFGIGSSSGSGSGSGSFTVRTPSPTPSPSPWPTPSPTPSPTPEETPSPTPSPTPQPTPRSAYPPPLNPTCA